MKIVESQQKALTKLALSLGQKINYRGHSQESLNLIWPYCHCDSIVLYRFVDNQNWAVVSYKGRLTPHQTAQYDKGNIAVDAYNQLLKGEMVDFETAYQMGLQLPALQEDGIKSGLVFPIVVANQIEAIAVLISYTTDTWTEDTVEWVKTAFAMIANAIKRTVKLETMGGE